MAMPTAISRIASAATPAMASVMVSTVWRPPRLLEVVGVHEQARRQVDALDLELLDELGPDPGRLQPALDLPFGDARLLEDEDVLHDDNVAFHALDFRDVRDLAGAVLETALVDDQVDCRRDLLA